jgi:hypothetical protein
MKARLLAIPLAASLVVLAPGLARAQSTCDDVAQKAADQAKANGLSPLQVDRAYGAALLQCKGVKDPSLAAVAAAVNLDYARLARLFLANRLTTVAYLQRVQDRSAKLRIARRDPAYRAAFVTGDTDGDLVPDDRDKCDDTPELAPTGRDGCPGTPPPVRAPNDDVMARARRAFKNVALVSNPACAEAPVPDRPMPLHQGFLRPDGNIAHHFFGMAVSRVRNLPAGCPAFYQFNFRFSDRADATWPVSKLIQVTFADKETADSGPTVDARRIFKVFQADTSQRKDLWQSSIKYGHVDWRVRAIGANGQTSLWSDWRHDSFNGVFKPDGP